LKGYELCIILQPDTNDAAIDELFGTIGAAIAKYNGAVIKTEKWGKRNLKFQIKKQSKGNFSFIFFNGTADTLKEIDRIVRYNEQILRYTIMKLDKEISAAGESAAAQAAPAEAPAADVQPPAPEAPAEQPTA
jgi:small subunit ribosomal protein S6